MWHLVFLLFCFGKAIIFFESVVSLTCLLLLALLCTNSTGTGKYTRSDPAGLGNKWDLHLFWNNESFGGKKLIKYWNNQIKIILGLFWGKLKRRKQCVKTIIANHTYTTLMINYKRKVWYFELDFFKNVLINSYFGWCKKFWLVPLYGK